MLEKTLENLLDCKEIQPVHPKGDQSLNRKSVLNIHWKDWHWSWNANTLATWCKELTHWKRSWCWARLKAGGEGDDRGWDVWMASLTRWTWVWVSSGSWWWTGKPGVLQSMGSARVRHNWATEPNWKKKSRDMPSIFSSLLPERRHPGGAGVATLTREIGKAKVPDTVQPSYQSSTA